jgi:acetylornithine deacetylase
MMSAEAAVHDALERLEASGIRMLQDLVRIPSAIGQEAAVQSEVARMFRDLGLEVHVFDIDPVRLESAPLFNRHPRNYKDRPCVVAVLRGQKGGRSLVLNAHADTAPPGDPTLWTRGPHSGDIDEEGRLFGRGAWDDKAGIAQMISIASAIRESGTRLEGDLILKSVVEDEESGNGTLACIERGFVGDGVIILDGTWPERYSVAHMGHLWFEITLRGRGAPSCVASRGLNPLLGIGAVVKACENFIAAKNREDGRSWGTAAEPYFLNFGRIEGGDYPGSVPRSCRMMGHYGFLPPKTTAQAREELAQLMTEVGEAAGWPLEQPPDLRFCGADTPHFAGWAHSPMANVVKRSVRRLRNAELRENPITGWCDLRHYQSNPWHSPVPGLLYGPGGGANAHVENEYFKTSDFVPVAQVVATAALQWCGVASSSSFSTATLRAAA